jgi:hypothetical protein
MEKRTSLKNILPKHGNQIFRGERGEIGFQGLNLVLTRWKRKSYTSNCFCISIAILINDCNAARLMFTQHYFSAACNVVPTSRDLFSPRQAKIVCPAYSCIVTAIGKESMRGIH